ncbi:MAG: TIGR03435 family protein [Verrucomicrobiota bacterium]|jgi:uncharacterized protein (TIGR03435 family)
MRDMDDMALLREYTARQSETAFTTLVERHIGLVYCAALRQVRDPARAQEITQVVFLLLARKAHSLREGTILSAWLYRAARFAASDARKMAFRRQQREQQAVQLQAISPGSSEESAWEQIAPLLDEAMAALGEKDRHAVMLRFFDQKSLEDVGLALGIGTVAAQKRVWRAVDKLRQYFSRHGAAFSAGAITTALSAHAIHGVPSGLAATVAATAALKGVAFSGSTATLLKGTLKLMAWTKLKTAIVAGVAAFCVLGATITVIKVTMPPDYSWEVQNPRERALTNARPQLTILPTKFHPKGNWHFVLAPDGRCMGIQVTPERIIQGANNASDWMDVNELDLRTKVAAPLPEDEYDFICNLRQGASNALRHAIIAKFGVTASRQRVETNVLVLSVRNPNAVGLRLAWPNRNSKPAPSKPGHHSAASASIQSLAQWLEKRLKVMVMDQTGLNGYYAFDLDWNEPDPKHPDDEALKQALIDQLGLELTPKIQPVEMLVIEKAK